MTEALQYNDAIVYLPYADMCDEIYKYIEKYKDMPEVKCSNHKVVEMNIKKKNLTVICDPNIADGLTWKDVKARCDKAGILFTNQSIGTLLMQLQREYFKPMRAFLMPDQKAEVIKRQNGICLMCCKKLEQTQYDHIQPLARGGSNNLDNFQALCKVCHLDKTKSERENSDYIKCDNMASCFNPDAITIVSSQLFKQWAFVEKINLPKSKDVNKIKKIDHVKVEEIF
jgi:hypothetical protein